MFRRIDVARYLQLALTLVIADRGYVAARAQPSAAPQPAGAAQAATTPPPRDPFRAFPRLNVENLPGADALVAVIVEIDGRAAFHHTGFVFHEDTERRFLVCDDTRRLLGPDHYTHFFQFTFRGVVGWGDRTKIVPLEIIRTFVRPNCIVLAGRRDDLPQPLPRSPAPAVTPGDRFHVVGFESPPARSNWDYANAFARACEPVEVVSVREKSSDAAPSFVVAGSDGIRLSDGLLMTSDGTAAALIRTAMPDVIDVQSAKHRFGEFTCYPIAILQRFLEPHLQSFTATRSPSGDHGASMLEVRIVIPEPSLNNARLLISSKPLALYPKGDQEAHQAANLTWNSPPSIRKPNIPIHGDAWDGKGTDVVQLPLTQIGPSGAARVERAYSDEDRAARILNADPKPAILFAANYVPNDRAIQGYYVQCVFDDAAGQTVLLGDEQFCRVGIR